MYRIMELRLQAGMTLDQLAEKSGVCRTTIYFLEKDQEHVAMTKTLLALAKALGVTINDLFLPQ